MSRPLRIEYPGALYHVTSRGNERKEIFLDRLDRRRFLDLLSVIVRRFGWRVYAYCLMPNHYHLLLETPRPELVRGMQQLNGIYARRFNRRHVRSGHLFGGRFHSILIERDAHLVEVARYVVLNPVRAGICKLPEDYRWSSYRATAGLEKPPAFLAADELLRVFASRPDTARRHYKHACFEPIVEDPWASLRGQIYLGSEHFAQKAIGLGNGDRLDREIPFPQRDPAPPSLAELFDSHGEQAMLIAYREHGYRIGELADHLGCHYSTVSRRLRRLEGGR
ncbi:MAG: transposase [Gaiellaceae bacterium]